MALEAKRSRAVQVGGWSLIGAAVGFTAVFSYLAARFNYPAVLEGPASLVLPHLLQLGATGRGVWIGYALLPLLLVPASIGAHAALSESAPATMRAALVAGVLAALCMMLGLARWPTVHWALAQTYQNASPETRGAIDAVFSGLNTYLGRFIGEFAGELSLNALFICSGAALLYGKRRIAGGAAVAAGAIGLIASLRNVTAVVAPIAALNNAVLPLWLIVFGVVLLRTPRLARALAV